MSGRSRRAVLMAVSAGLTTSFAGCSSGGEAAADATHEVGVHDSSVFSVSKEELPADDEYHLLRFEDLSESEQEFLDQLLPNGYVVVCGAPDPDGPINNIALRDETNYNTYVEREEAHYGFYIRFQDQVYVWTGDRPPHDKVEEKVREDCDE